MLSPSLQLTRGTLRSSMVTPKDTSLQYTVFCIDYVYCKHGFQNANFKVHK